MNQHKKIARALSKIGNALHENKTVWHPQIIYSFIEKSLQNDTSISSFDYKSLLSEFSIKYQNSPNNQTFIEYEKDRMNKLIHNSFILFNSDLDIPNSIIHGKKTVKKFKERFINQRLHKNQNLKSLKNTFSDSSKKWVLLC